MGRTPGAVVGFKCVICAKGMRAILKLIEGNSVETIDGTCGKVECLAILAEHSADETAASILAELTALYDTPMHDRKLDAYKSSLKEANAAAPKYFKELRENKYNARRSSTLGTAVAAVKKAREMKEAGKVAVQDAVAELENEMAKMTPKVRKFFVFVFFTLFSV